MKPEYIESKDCMSRSNALSVSLPYWCGDRMKSSFSSSATSSFDECFSPAKSGSTDTADFTDVSFSERSMGTCSFTSSAEDEMLYSGPSLNQSFDLDFMDDVHLHQPTFKRAANAYMCEASGGSRRNLKNDSLPPLLVHDLSSPLQSSPHSIGYVVPSQTYTPIRYRPVTPPMDDRHLSSSPPFSSYGRSPMRPVKYFMSPHTPDSKNWLEHPSRALATPPNGVLESSAVLHRIQSPHGARVSKSSKMPQLKAKIKHVPKSSFRCQFEGCKNRNGFQRREHLKRHLKIHLDNSEISCEICGKGFRKDRWDNFRTHVLRHTHPKGKGTRRAVYSDEAKAYYERIATTKQAYNE
jgi:hypothetical protein